MALGNAQLGGMSMLARHFAHFGGFDYAEEALVGIVDRNI